MMGTWKPWLAVGDGRLIDSQNKKEAKSKPLDRREIENQKARIRYRVKVLNRTNEEHEQFNAAMRAKGPSWQEYLGRMTDEQREKTLQRKRERDKARKARIAAEKRKKREEEEPLEKKGRKKETWGERLAKMTDEKREEYLAQRRERDKARREKEPWCEKLAKMTEEERESILAQKREKERARRKEQREKMTDEEREAFLAKKRERERERKAKLKQQVSEEKEPEPSTSSCSEDDLLLVPEATHLRRTSRLKKVVERRIEVDSDDETPSLPGNRSRRISTSPEIFTEDEEDSIEGSMDCDTASVRSEADSGIDTVSVRSEIDPGSLR